MQPNRKSEARERLLEVAGDLFYREGIRAVGVDRIIAQAGVAKTTLYRHFPSKDALVAAWLERYEDDGMAWLAAHVDASQGNRLLAVFDALSEWFKDPGFRGSAFINSQAELGTNGLASRIVAAHRGRLCGYFESLARDEGVKAPKGAAGDVTLLFQGAIVSAAMSGDRGAARQAKGAASKLLRA